MKEGLKCMSNTVVNPISLEACEEEFLRPARLSMRYDAAVAILRSASRDRQPLRRKGDTCQEPYKLPRRELNCPLEGIIFVANVLTIATGLPEHKACSLGGFQRGA